MRGLFWDIESLPQAFTICAYDTEVNTNHEDSRLHVFYIAENIPGVRFFDTQNPNHDYAWAEKQTEIALYRKIAKSIKEKNKNFNGKILFYDLQQTRHLQTLAKMFGASDAGSTFAFDLRNDIREAAIDEDDENTPEWAARHVAFPDSNANNPLNFSSIGAEYRLGCDTDIDATYVNDCGETITTKAFDKDNDYYILGYNSYNYDTTMLAYFLANSISYANGRLYWKAVPASEMRMINDELFTDRFIHAMPSALSLRWDPKTKTFQRGEDSGRYRERYFQIRKNMIDSGRYIDVARLNERQYKTALKRMLGLKGLQIMESDKLRGDQPLQSSDDFAELLAYNTSDVVNLCELFEDPTYYTQFQNKRSLMEQYPDCVYEEWPKNSYKCEQSPLHVRGWGRLTPDSKSAVFAARILCPWKHLDDIETVSFMYPSERVAAQTGIKRSNILSDCKKFIEDTVGLDSGLWKEFKPVYDFYKRIEGKNFNGCAEYANKWAKDGRDVEVNDLNNIAKTEAIVHYWFDKDTPSDCYINFSVGGIHGAQLNDYLLNEKKRLWREDIETANAIKGLCDDDPKTCKRAQCFYEIADDGTCTTLSPTVAIKTGTLANAAWKDLATEEPNIKTQSIHGMKLDAKYAFTSVGLANHEDFSSYYPNMLRRMDAFRNPHMKTEDRYATIYEQKQTYGKYEKDMSLSEEERERYHLIRNGTKLILNAATGAADTKDYGYSIQVNNQIISMRIIGQLFSWMIGQAQAFAGAQVVSTNTDGLYTIFDEKKNNEILEEQSKKIAIQIDPEPVILVSKDANNRLEISTDDTHRILAGNGGSLSHWRGPDLGKTLSHPAVQDWICAQYLKTLALGGGPQAFTKPFDMELARNILADITKDFHGPELLRMFSNLLASNPSSHTYVFGRKPSQAEPVILQHYNRAFYLKNPTDTTLHIYAAAARKVPKHILQKRRNEDLIDIEIDKLAQTVLEANGIDSEAYQRLNSGDAKYDIVVKKMPNVNPEWNVLIDNRSLFDMTEDQLQELYDALDMGVYLGLARDTYEKNWRNATS